MPEFSVLTVCSGNICRSPLAEQILRARLADLPSIEFASAGTFAGEGDRMPDEAAELSVRFGGDPSQHSARYLTEQIVGGSDLILAMSRSHRREIVELVPRKVSVTFTLREFARLSEGLPDAEIAEAASRGTTVRAGLAEVVALVVSRKGQVGLPSSTDVDDIIDPYRRSAETYERSAAQLVPAAEEVARVLRVAAGAAGPAL
ncbi:arsenate reductase/protein-tyrosine-phosphatase family protein [Herbiconiux daphne]|uniref:protein-tyrosine-phosphatase n=1 Tax=Herbiconiux daphne TaxID=2970914 RepID=A0ABT2H6T5_9MICO|nr:low molecular weight phosphatase family protein [Herbiconiux daphne]MCS5735619.1 low molecular weight phosphatase family protein [Herbiconiux daphne]